MELAAQWTPWLSRRFGTRIALLFVGFGFLFVVPLFRKDWTLVHSDLASQATTRTKSVGNTSDKQQREEWCRFREDEATHALQTLLEENGGWNYPFASQDYALSNGLPIPWDAGTLEELFQRRHHLYQEETATTTKVPPKLEIVLVGGSSSTRPANGCGIVDPLSNHSWTGRFSDYLEYYLLQHEQRYLSFRHNESAADSGAAPSPSLSSASSPFLRFGLTRRANGNHDSPTDAMLLDGAVDANQTDIIVWDFLINDWQKEGYPLLAVRLDFWLARLHAHFRQANRAPPAILLMYLWKNSASNHPSPASRALENGTQQVIQKYRRLGWKIAVVDVGAAVDPSRLSGEGGSAARRALFDDVHHPACEGVRFIAHLLQYALYSNLVPGHHNHTTTTVDEEVATNTTFSPEAALQGPTYPSVPSHEESLDHLAHPGWRKLWEDLFRETTRVGSISAWEPRNPLNSTRLRVSPGTIEVLEEWPKLAAGKVDPRRTDRKNAFVVPPCSSNNETFSSSATNHSSSSSSSSSSALELSLLEPSLQWIGLSVAPKNDPRMEVRINGILIPRPPPGGSWKTGTVYLSRWIDLSETPVDRNDAAGRYTIRLCHNNSEEDEESEEKGVFHVQHIVGVMVAPTNSSSSLRRRRT